MWSTWAERMNQAATAADRAEVVAEVMRLSGRGKDWAYRTLRAAGWDNPTSGNIARTTSRRLTRLSPAPRSLSSIPAKPSAALLRHSSCCIVSAH